MPAAELINRIDFSTETRESVENSVLPKCDSFYGKNANPNILRTIFFCFIPLADYGMRKTWNGAVKGYSLTGRSTGIFIFFSPKRNRDLLRDKSYLNLPVQRLSYYDFHLNLFPIVKVITFTLLLNAKWNLATGFRSKKYGIRKPVTALLEISRPKG